MSFSLREWPLQNGLGILRRLIQHREKGREIGGRGGGGEEHIFSSTPIGEVGNDGDEDSTLKQDTRQYFSFNCMATS